MGKYPLMFSADHLKSHFQQIVSLLWSVGGNLSLGAINLKAQLLYVCPLQSL